MNDQKKHDELFKKLPKKTRDFLVSDSIDIYAQLLAEQTGLSPEIGVDIEDIVRDLVVKVITEADLPNVVAKLDGITDEKSKLITDDILSHIRNFEAPELASKEAEKTTVTKVTKEAPKEKSPVNKPKLVANIPEKLITPTNKQSQPLPNPPAPPKAPSNPFEAKLKETFNKEKTKEIFSKKDADSQDKALPPVPKKPTTNPYREPVK